ncbi:hypothetical protein EBU94_04310, partial [bacterium]|nr:hypothetical protein [bacterium]
SNNLYPITIDSKKYYLILHFTPEKIIEYLLNTRNEYFLDKLEADAKHGFALLVKSIELGYIGIVKGIWDYFERKGLDTDLILDTVEGHSRLRQPSKIWGGNRQIDLKRKEIFDFLDKKNQR